MKSYFPFLKGYSKDDKHIAKALIKDPDFRAELYVSEIADQILKVLDRVGLNTADLARKLGESRSSVSQKLSGNPNMKVVTLFRLADAAGRTLPLPVLEECSFNQLDPYQNVDEMKQISNDHTILGEAFLTIQCKDELIVEEYHPMESNSVVNFETN